MVSYAQSNPTITLIRPYIQISIVDDTTLMVTSSRYQTIVDEPDGLEWQRLVDEINKKDYLLIKVKSDTNKEHRIVLLTYVYDVRQPPRGFTGSGQYRSNRGQNWENRLQKVYNTLYISYDNGIIIK